MLIEFLFMSKKKNTLLPFSSNMSKENSSYL